MSRDTLLLLSTSYPEASDGSEAAGAFVADVAEVLSTMLPVRIVGPGRCESGPTKEFPSTWRFAGAGKPLSLLSASRPADWPVIFSVLGSMRRQAHAACADGRVAHSLAFWVLPSGWMARDLQKSHGIPYSIWALGSDIWTLGRVPGVTMLLRRVIEDAAFRFADGLQLASDAQQIGSLPFEFLPSARAALVSDPPPPIGQPPWRLLFLGRWHPNKGIDLLLDALSLLPDEAWGRVAQVTIAGGGPLEGLVHEGVRRLRADGRSVVLRGFLSANAASEEIVAADWVLIPSRIESIPVVLSDALKAGRPVVVTDVGDMGQLVARSPACGVVAASVTPQAIADAIAKAMLVGPTGFSEGVRALAGTFNLERIAERLQQATMPSISQ